MQQVFLDVLQQAAAYAVHDALGFAGGAGRIQDEQRRIKGQSGVARHVVLRMGLQQVLPERCAL